MRDVFFAAVWSGTKEMNGRPRSLEKYASEIAVLPEEHSIIVVSGPILPLLNPHKNRDLAKRCFKLPDGWVLSSFK